MNAHFRGTPFKRFLHYIQICEDECWRWTGSIDQYGYGILYLGKPGTILAHRFSYALFRGSIPRGREIHHSCRVKNCVNPWHLVALTRAEHARFGLHALKDRCIRGHLFDENNTRVRKGTLGRSCRQCNRDKAARYQEKKRRLQALGNIE